VQRELRRARQRLGACDLDRGAAAGPQRRVEFLDARDADLLVVLLEEWLAVDAGGAAYQRTRLKR
jgi:hypothetical protein